MKQRSRYSEPEAWSCACGDHWWAKLTKGFVVLVSPEDHHFLFDGNWTTQIAPKRRYAKRGLSNNKTIFLHREILGDVIQVDHENMNGLDDRRHNIRPADASGNAANCPKPRTANPTSQFKGVRHVRRRGRLSKPWLVMCAGQYIGYFSSEQDAALAYDKAAVKTYGPFARTNIMRNAA